MTGLVAHLPLAPWLSPEVYPGKNGAWASRGLHALRRLARFHSKGMSWLMSVSIEGFSAPD